MQLSARRRGMGVKGPYDARIEYLESRANCYINTGINAANNIGLELEYVDTYNYGNCSNYVIGARVTQNSTILYSISGATATNAVSVTYNGSSNTLSYTRKKNDKYHAIVNAHGSTMDWEITINDTNIQLGTINGTDLGTTNTPICMFGFNASNIKQYTRLYYLKMKRNGVIVRDFIPVRVGTVGCLYDRVSRSLFYNTGSGTFVLGPDK